MMKLIYFASIKKAFWLFPFIAFCAGYCFLQYFITDTTVQVPALLGNNLLQATEICSQLKLNLRIITQKEVADLQPGTIVRQKPLPGTFIKPHQSIFIVITKQPAPILAPDFMNKHKNFIDVACKEKGIKNRMYMIESTYPQDQCFGQTPVPGQALDLKKMSSYISAGNPTQFLFPDFMDSSLNEVIEFLKKYEISSEIYHNNQKIDPPYKQTFVVINQKPLAGTFVQPNNKLYVQLQVRI